MEQCRHSGMHGMLTFGYAWNANIRVCVECNTGTHLWNNADIWVYMECKRSGMHGMQTFRYAWCMQTFGYAWNADIRVYVECKHSGTHGVCRHSGMKYSKYSLESCACSTLSKEFRRISSCLVIYIYIYIYSIFFKQNDRVCDEQWIRLWLVS